MHTERPPAANLGDWLDPQVLEQSWSRCSDIVDAEVDNESVLMSIETGQYLFMNATASAVWRELDEPRTLASLRDRLVQRYAVDEQRCAREVHVLLLRLEAQRVVEQQSSR